MRVTIILTLLVLLLLSCVPADSGDNKTQTGNEEAEARDQEDAMDNATAEDLENDADSNTELSGDGSETVEEEPSEDNDAEAINNEEDATDDEAEDPEEDDPLAGVTVIEMKNIAFSPSEITVNVGDTVMWINKEEKHKHKVYDTVPGEQVFYSETLNPGENYTYTFTKAGVYAYRDSIFPDKMSGKITVVE